MRKTMIAAAAVLALGAGSMTAAVAAPHGGVAGGVHAMGGSPGGGGRPGGGFAAHSFGGGGNAFAGRNFSGGAAHAFGGNRGHSFRGGVAVGGGPWYGPGYYDYDYGYGGCWVSRLVRTPFGLRRRLVNVCY